MVSPVRSDRVSYVPPRGGVEHGLRHMAHPVVDRAPFGGDQPHRRLGVEPFLQHHGPTVREQRHQGVRRGKTPAERHRQPQAVGAGEMLALADVKAVLEARRVGQGDAFRPRGTAGGVEHVQEIGRLHPCTGGAHHRRVQVAPSCRHLVKGSSRRQRRLAQDDQLAQRRQSRGIDLPGRTPRGFGDDLAEHRLVIGPEEAVQRHEGDGLGVVQGVLELRPGATTC